MQNAFKTAIIPYQGELAGDVLQTPFARAILLPDTVGTLLLVDANCTPMTRAWCVLEAWVTTIKATGKRFDVAAMIPEKTYTYGDEEDYEWIEPGPALRMDLGNGAHKDVVGPENGWFPGTVATAGVAVKVEEADASRKEDLESILRILAGSDKDAPPPAHCQGYDAVNKAYHALFRGPAMYELAMAGKSEELRQLLEAGSEAVHYRSAASGTTPLFIAVCFGQEKCVELLLGAGAKVDQARDSGSTPLFMAAQEGQEKCVELLLGAHAAVNQADNDGCTPLYTAAS